MKSSEKPRSISEEELWERAIEHGTFSYTDEEWAAVEIYLPPNADEKIRTRLEEVCGNFMMEAYFDDHEHLAKVEFLYPEKELSPTRRSYQKKQWRDLADKARKLRDAWPPGFATILDVDFKPAPHPIFLIIQKLVAELEYYAQPTKKGKTHVLRDRLVCGFIYQWMAAGGKLARSNQDNQPIGRLERFLAAGVNPALKRRGRSPMKIGAASDLVKALQKQGHP